MTVKHSRPNGPSVVHEGKKGGSTRCGFSIRNKMTKFFSILAIFYSVVFFTTSALASQTVSIHEHSDFWGKGQNFKHGVYDLTQTSIYWAYDISSVKVGSGL